jgi:hypothetical protein
MARRSSCISKETFGVSGLRSAVGVTLPAACASRFRFFHSCHGLMLAG